MVECVMLKCKYRRHKLYKVFRVSKSNLIEYWYNKGVLIVEVMPPHHDGGTVSTNRKISGIVCPSVMPGCVSSLSEQVYKLKLCNLSSQVTTTVSV